MLDRSEQFARLARDRALAQWIDPPNVAGLTDDSRYSVVIDGIGGTVGAIVMELNFQGGDGALIYEGAFR